jgi:hypothetical protein
MWLGPVLLRACLLLARCVLFLVHCTPSQTVAVLQTFLQTCLKPQAGSYGVFANLQPILTSCSCGGMLLLFGCGQRLDCAGSFLASHHGALLTYEVLFTLVVTDGMVANGLFTNLLSSL